LESKPRQVIVYMPVVCYINMKKQILITLLALFFSSCDQDKVNPNFTLKYVFINEGDSQVGSVALKTRTYFPKEEKWAMFYEQYFNVSQQDTLVKAIEGPYSYSAYKGCTTGVIQDFAAMD
jgi:hypothetical protein